MNSEQLLQNFDRIAESPGSIAHLRRFILDLAVRGKLVEQDPDPVYLLQQIRAEKERLVREGKIKKEKPRPLLTDEEIPVLYADPCLYERLGNIAILQKGLTGIQRAKSGSFPLVVTAEERSSCDHFDFEGAAAIIPMVSSTGHGNASMKRLHYQEGKFALGNILCAVFPISPQLVSARFIYEYLTAFKEELLVAQMIGTANVSLTINKISDIPVPIVSPVAQKRLDELMGLCDRLEAAQKDRESQRDRLVASSLHHLNQATEKGEFRDRAQFYFDRLPKLTTRSEHIKQLRQTILNLAVCGKLVPQDPNDEPASELLNAIDTERKILIQNGCIKKSKQLPVILQDDIPFDLPQKWQWVRLGSLSLVVTSGSRDWAQYYSENGAIFLRMGNLSRGSYLLRLDID